MRRIGLFAGTFDPVHDGHIEVALSVLDALDLDKVYFLVEEKPWGSKDPVSVEHRRQMVDIATNDNDQISQLVTIGEHFTIDKTLPSLEQIFSEDELYFVFGADVFIHMNPDQWPNLDELLKHYIVVFERGVLSEKRISEHARNLGIAAAIVPSTHPQHSSTDVRLEAHNKAIWVPESVALYIEEHSLYQT